MKPTTMIAGVLAVLAAAAGIGKLRAAVAPTAAAPTSSEREKKIAEILPTPEEERWLEVPWRTNVSDAIAESRRTGKPVLFWVMNGNPLGCA